MKRKNSKLFIRNFTLLFLLLFLLLACFSIYIYQNSKRILEEELTNYNLQNTEYLSNTFEQEIEEAKYLVSSLTINTKISALMSSPTSSFVSTYYLSDITDILQSVCYSNQAVETIYIYCESNNRIYRPESSHVVDYAWIDHLDPDENGISIFPYALYEQFPYVICIAKETEFNGMRSVICCMLNLASMASLNELTTSKIQHFFVVSDEDYIIYRDRQRGAREPLSVSRYLSHYDSEAHTPVIYTDESVPYAFSQLRSAEYPWTYALCTQLTDYTSRLSSSRAAALALGFFSILLSVLLAFFISNRSLKPIISIRRLLDTPQYFSEKGVNNTEEITYIAKKIISYIQTNQQLAKELDNQISLLVETRKQNLQLQINPHFLFNTLNILYMQAVDSLGYEHTLPEMTQNLGALLRYSLEPSYMTTFQTELHYTNIYLELLVRRYGEDISIIQDIGPDVSDAKGPRLFLQPIIENSVFHGFARQHHKECVLSISCRTKESAAHQGSSKKLVLSIADNGSGMDGETLRQLQACINDRDFPDDDGRHIGLRNVSQRLNLFFADDAQITVTSTRNIGTTFIITLPYIT